MCVCVLYDFSKSLCVYHAFRPCSMNFPFITIENEHVKESMSCRVIGEISREIKQERDMHVNVKAEGGIEGNIM